MDEAAECPSFQHPMRRGFNGEIYGGNRLSGAAEKGRRIEMRRPAARWISPAPIETPLERAGRRVGIDTPTPQCRAPLLDRVAAFLFGG